MTVALIVSGSCSASWGGFSVTFVTAGAISIKAGPLAAPGVGLRKAGALPPDGIPYETPLNCTGYVGANSLTISLSGSINARYSPALASRKFASCAPLIFAAKTIRYSPAGTFCGGNSHLFGRSGSSVSDHPPSSIANGFGLWISIQSSWSPSASVSPFLLSATNSFSTRGIASTSTPTVICAVALGVESPTAVSV